MLISEKPVKRVKAVIPPGFALDEPLAHEYKSRLIGPDEVVSAFLASVDQAGAFEDSQVARNGGRGDAERLGQLGYGALVAGGQREKDAAARGIGQGGEDGGGLCGIVNQVVKHIIEARSMWKRSGVQVLALMEALLPYRGGGRRRFRRRNVRLRLHGRPFGPLFARQYLRAAQFHLHVDEFPRQLRRRAPVGANS